MQFDQVHKSIIIIILSFVWTLISRVNLTSFWETIASAFSQKLKPPRCRKFFYNLITRNISSCITEIRYVPLLALSTRGAGLPTVVGDLLADRDFRSGLSSMSFTDDAGGMLDALAGTSGSFTEGFVSLDVGDSTDDNLTDLRVGTILSSSLFFDSSPLRGIFCWNI